ncbi:PKD domain-containing protein [Dactylosporangium sp. CA-052675]|uniref:PKD domain-containing protein n=1 Tax=Dactylosporangium sp. CA-052675 TaxID=3239927 RepID=UPI003D9131B9
MQKLLSAGLAATVGAATALVVVVAPAAAAAGSRQVVYVGGSGSGLATVVDAATGKDINTIGDTGGAPQPFSVGRIAVDPGRGLAYVANNTSGLNVVDVARSRIITTVPRVGSGDLSVALTPGGDRAYIADDSDKSLAVVDVTGYKVIASVVVGQNPKDVAVAPDGRHAYVVAAETYTNPHGNVAVVDTATNTVTATIQVGSQSRAIAVTPDGKHAYVANLGDNTVSVLDLATNAVTATIAVGARPLDVAMAPDGARAYVSSYEANSVAVIDTATNAVAATVPVGAHAHTVAVAPDGRRAFIAADDGTSGLMVPFDPATGATGPAVKIDRIPARAVFVDVAAPAGPAADFTVTPIDGAPNTFELDPGVSRAGLARLTSFTLDTGDGTTITSSTRVRHTYRAVGTYTVTLTVADADGRTAVVGKQVQAQTSTRKLSLLALSSLRYVSAEARGGKPLVANRTAAGEWEQFDMVDLGGGDVALHSAVTGLFVAPATIDGKLMATADQAHPFQLVVGTDGALSLRDRSSGKFVSSNYDGVLTTDRDAIGPWERFAGTVATNVSWSSVVRGFVCAENGGRGALIANRTQVGSWETYDLIDAGSGQVAFFAHADYRFVTAEAAGNQPLIANRTAIGAWEKFKIVVNPEDGTRSLVASVNGKYVTAEAGGMQPLIANRTAVGPWEKFQGLPS